MSETIRWLIPAALSIAAAPACYAVQYMSAEQARSLMFPDAGEFAAAPLKLSRPQVQAVEDASGIRVRVPEQQVWQARVDGKLLGWVIVDEVYGKHEFITYAVGLNLDGSVRQVEVLDYRETYGYEIRHPAWRRQFVGKRYGDTLKLDADIKNISGATLSCRHITDGVKRLLALYQVALKPSL
jgi:Na+-translocating ferredoxin:NAD+ oxidoreductase RnfG subunit